MKAMPGWLPSHCSWHASCNTPMGAALAPVCDGNCMVRGVYMKFVIAIIRPHRLESVKEALSDAGVVGLTVTDVRGAGRQKGQIERYRGSEYTIDLIAKIKLELAVEDDQVETVVQAIRKSAYTGEIGDGKIFILPLEDSMRIRTGDRGESSL